MRRTDPTDYYYDNEDRYYEEREDAFKKHMEDQVKSFMSKTDVMDMTAENFAEYLEDFEFEDIDDWMASEYEGALGDYADRKYDEYRDGRMGL